jgi:hypothetical protein
MSVMSILKITDIIWDTDGEPANLPTEIDFFTTMKEIDIDTVLDWLSDEYGFCVFDFCYEFKEEEDNFQLTQKL